MPAPHDSVSPVRELIESRCFEPLDGRRLARAARLSPAHLRREFHRAFGESPHQHLLARRMQRAVELVHATDVGIEDVCHGVGLPSLGSFMTRFAQTFGITPASYRAVQRGPWGDRGP
jgi:AraC-like DNA-binding protein